MGLIDRLTIRHNGPTPQTAASVKSVSSRQLDRPTTEARESSEAWQVWRKVGEVHYSTTQQARLVGRLDWTIKVNKQPLEADQADAVLEAAFGDNLRSLANTSAIHLQVSGGYILARCEPGDRESWKVLATPLSAKNKRTVKNADIVIEVRTPDPKDEELNDSPVLAALDVCRELILYRGQSRATARSRTAQLNTVFYPADAFADPTKFETDLMSTMIAPLADERTTASVVPNLVGMPGEKIEQIKSINLTGDSDEKVHEKIERLVRSLAIQLDVPPELLLGQADSNHWSAWAIQEDNYLGHIEPLAEPIGRGFALAIIAAAGEVEGNLRIEPDPGPLLQRRPTVADTAAAFEANVVTAEFYREQLGATEADAPEILEFDPVVEKALSLVAGAPSLLQSPGLGVLIEQIRTALNGGTPGPVQIVDAEVVSDTADPPAAVRSGPASAEPAAIAASLRTRLVPIVAAATAGPDGRALAEIDVQAYAALEDLVTDTTDRALERLGAKVRTMSRGRETEIPPDYSNAQLAVSYVSTGGTIPNGDVAVEDTIAATLPKVERIVRRAFTRLRGAGVDLTADPTDLSSALDLYGSLVSEIVVLAVSGRPTDAAIWTAARRIASVAGGNGDSAVSDTASSAPLAAAAGTPVTGLGIALGKRAIDMITATYQVVLDQYRWWHLYSGKSPHPEHAELNGTLFNGQYLLRDGINWFPGDHAGCACVAVPEFREVAAA